MTKRDFFIVLIRTMAAALLLINIFTFFPTLIYLVEGIIDTKMLVYTFAVILIVFGIFYFLFMKTGKIVDFLKMTKGLDGDDISFGKVNEKIVAQLVFVGIGMWIIVAYLPYLISSLVFAFKDSIGQFSQNALTDYMQPYPSSSYNLLAYTITVLLGFLLVRYNSVIAVKVFGFGEEQERQ